MGEFLASVLASLVAMALAWLAGAMWPEPLHRFAARRCVAILIPKSAQTLSGTWKASYLSEQLGGNLEADVRLGQFRNRIYGLGMSSEPLKVRYSIHATLEGNSLIGAWHDLEKESRYAGVFYAELARDGTQLEGQWLGSDQQDLLTSGPWSMKRLV